MKLLATKQKHTITLLRQIAEASGTMPTAWRIMEINDNDYELQFTYDDPGMQIWLPVQLRTAASKHYKSLHACFSDIKKIVNDSQTTIYFLGK